ncbi:MAG: selenium cofactor biosynthesis protein YqeC [Anaerolineae bacterium]|nr:selenium cofactor biosynthesis protein YqeC [Anaerolineae bacterium]
MRICDALRIRPGDVVSLVGGGGKTTIMFRLAAELTAAGMTVITTMTTRIFVGQMERAPAHLLLRDEASLFAALPAALAEHGHVLVGGRIGADREKVEGVPPEFVDRLAAGRWADVIIVEADGSRRLPFKAPAAHEPVVPASTSILAPLVGLDILGQPLDANHAHRPELVAALTGASEGESITAAARLVPFLNKVDLPGIQQDAHELAKRLLAHANVDEVILAAAETEAPAREVWDRTAAIVLAAGQASRFGSLKQVTPWRGKPLVAHVAQQALSCADIDTVVATVGAERERVKGALAPYAADGGLTLARVEDWAEGQSRSAAAGLRAALATASGPLSAAVFLLADQPYVTPELLSALIQRHRETRALAVAPRFDGKRGNPVLFDRRSFPLFEVLAGDEGGRSILREREGEMAFVDWPTGEILRDIDTPEDYDAESAGRR